MKKIIILFVIICTLFISSYSCTINSKINICDEEAEWLSYLDLFYEEINTEGRKYVGIDLRTKEDYEDEHLRQFQNYDISKGSIEELNNWLSSNYSNKYIVYIYIESLDDLSSFDSLLKKFKDIYIYIGEFETLRTLGDELFTFDSGPYDCNC